MKKMNKIKLIRNVLYIIGVFLFLAIIANSLFHTNHMWIYEFKSESFNSFLEYYLTRAKGEILIALIAGLISTGLGIYIDRKCINKK